MLGDFYVVNNFGAELYNNALQDLLRQAYVLEICNFIQMQEIQEHYSLPIVHYLWDLTEIYS